MEMLRSRIISREPGALVCIVYMGSAVTAGETELEMAVRHVAEQEQRITRQEVLIERLRGVGAPLDGALELLASMQDLLEMMRDHVDRISPPAIGSA